MLQSPFIVSALIITATMTVSYVVSIIKDDFSVVDIFWPIGILLVTLYNAESANTINGIFIKLFVTIWSIRLCAYLIYRNMTRGPDARYMELSASWGPNGFFKAILYIYIPQSVLMYLICMPIISISYITAGSNALIALGSFLWLVGIVLESTADYQLFTFIGNPKNKGQYLTSGLFKYSRHPNYLGESIIWIGIAILALPNNLSFLPLIGPVVLTICLYIFTGVPYAERNRRGKEFERYVKTTGAIFPKLF